MELIRDAGRYAALVLGVLGVAVIGIGCGLATAAFIFTLGHAAR